MNLFVKLKQRCDWKDLLALSVGIGTVLALGLSQITRGSIWFDEAFSEHISRHSFFDIARYTALDVHPPLYYWALKVWRTMFGNSEIALRSMSLFFLVMTIVVVYFLVRKYFTRRAAVISVVLLAVSPMLFRYGVEARMYTMEAFIAVTATFTLLKAYREKNKKMWITYGALVGLGLITHYLTALMWIGHALWLYIQSSQKKFLPTVKKMLKSGYGLSIIAGIVVSLGWLPFMVTQLVHIQGGGFWIKPVSVDTVPNFIANMYTYMASSEATGWTALAIIAVSVATIYYLQVAYKSMIVTNDRQAYSLIFMSAVAPVVLLFITSMPPLRPSFVDRYLLPSIVMWVLLVAVAATHLMTKHKKVIYPKTVLVATGILFIIGCAHVINVGNVNKDNGSPHTMRTAMQIIADNSLGHEPIIADSSWRYYEASYYERLPQRVYFRSEDNTKIGAYAMLRDEVSNKIIDLNAFGREHGIVWFITSGPHGSISRLPEGWQEVRTYQVDGAKELRVVKMKYIGR